MKRRRTVRLRKPSKRHTRPHARILHKDTFLPYFSSYIAPTQAKIILWAFLLIPYILVIILFSGVLPGSVVRAILALFYTSSMAVKQLSPSSFTPMGTQAVSDSANFAQLSLAYLSITYILSCVFVEIFGTIRRSTSRR